MSVDQARYYAPAGTAIVPRFDSGRLHRPLNENILRRH
jgi:hypothetical protein